MNDTQLHTLDQVEAFLVGTEAVDFSFADTAARYAWMEATLIRFGYRRLGRRPKGVLRRYLQRVTGYSRQQLTRLLARYRKTCRVDKQPYARHRFTRLYTPQDGLP